MGRRSALLAVMTALAAGAGGLVLATAPAAQAYGAGVWKVSCAVSHSLPDDPIVHPDRPGASHLHDFFGSAATNASTTYASMQGVRSTCPNNDRSAYWVPALYQNGKKIDPASLTAYYVSPVSPTQDQIQAFPPNFRMITGDAANTDPAKVSGHIQWGCTGNTQIGRVVPTNCPATGGIQVRITFPACWDGVQVPNGDSAAHMRFPSGNKCPKGFERPLPTVRLNISYRTGADTGKITLSSGSVNSIHADLVNGWHQPTLDGLVKKCMHGKIDCGHFKGTTAGGAPPVHPVAAAPPKKPAKPDAPPAAGRSAAPAALPAEPTTSPSSAPSTALAAGGGEPSDPISTPGTALVAAPDDNRATAAQPGIAQRWRLVSEDGSVNVPAVVAAGLLLVALALTGGLTVAALRRRGATGKRHATPWRRPATG